MFIIIVLTTFKNLIFLGLVFVLLFVRVFILGCPTLMCLSIAASLFVIVEWTCFWVSLTLMFLVMLGVVIVVAMVTSVIGGIVVGLAVELGVVSGRVVILFLGKNRYLQDLGKVQAVVIVAS